MFIGYSLNHLYTRKIIVFLFTFNNFIHKIVLLWKDKKYLDLVRFST